MKFLSFISIFVVLALFQLANCQQQPLQLPVSFNVTWVDGSPSYNTYYPTTATPGARTDSCSAYLPAIGTGNDQMYMYGGSQSNSNTLYLDLASFTWSIISNGSSAASYGTTQISLSLNQPGPLYGHKCDVGSADQMFYMFGGFNNSPYTSYLWRWDSTTVYWALMSGSTSNSSVVFSGYNAESINNSPASRAYHSLVAHPSKPLIFVFGGNQGISQALNDFWYFNTSSNTWALLGGNNNTYNAQTNYSTAPGGRYSSSLLFSSSSNTILLFGGKSSSASLNEVWSFSLERLSWSFISGNNQANFNANTSLGQFGVDNSPASVYGHTANMLAQSDIMVVFGGVMNSTGSISNSIFMYNVTGKTWAIVSVSSPGTNGALCISNATTYPPARYGHVAVSSLRSLFLTIFSGATVINSQTYYTDDVWMFNFTSATNVAPLGITASSSSSSTSSASVATLNPTSSTAVTTTASLNSTSSKTTTTLTTTTKTTTVTPTTTSTRSTSPKSTSSRFTSIATSTSTAPTVSPTTISVTKNTVHTTTNVNVNSDVSSYLYSATASLTFSSALPSSTAESLTATIAPTPTVLPGKTAKPFAGPLAETSSPIPIIIGVAAAALLCIVTCCYVVYCCNRTGYTKKRSNAAYDTAYDTETATTMSSMYSEFASATTFARRQEHGAMESKNAEATATTMGNTFMTNTNTVFQSDVVAMSFPAFLEMIDHKDFEATTSIGQGGFGSIWAGKLTTAQMISQYGTSDCVVKRINFVSAEDTPERQDEVRGFQQEVSMMDFFKNNEHFAKLFGFCVEPVTIVMKLYPLGTLKDLVFEQIKRPLLLDIEYTTPLISSLACDLASGLAAMHEAGFGHHDIKPANVLLDRDSSQKLRAVLTDFGISRIVTDKSMLVTAFQKSKIRGASVAYAAPDFLTDMMNGNNNDTTLQDATVMSTAYGHSRRQERLLRADCYSFAVVLFEMMNRQPSWTLSAEVIIDKVLRGERPVWSRHTVEWCSSDSAAQTLKSIVESCWLQDPLSRMTMVSAVSMIRSQ